MMLLSVLLACGPPPPSLASHDTDPPPRCVPTVEVWNDYIDQDCDGRDVVDRDHDRSPLPDDCDDDDPSVYPGAIEIPYDGVDQDCDGVDPMDVDGDGAPVDEDCADFDPLRNLADHDDDGWTSCNGDCDDTDASVNPSGRLRCGDGIDGNCDGVDDCLFLGHRSLPQDAVAVIDTPPRALAAGDVDGDGVDELFVGAMNAPGELYRLPLSGEVSPAAAFATVEPAVYDATFVDLDGDGRDELLTTSWSGYEVRVYDGLEAGGVFTVDDILTQVRLGGSDYIPAALDSDGDGDFDVFTDAGGAWGFWDIVEGAQLITEAHTVISQLGLYDEVRSHPWDLDSDGLADVLLSGQEFGADEPVRVFLQAPIPTGNHHLFDFVSTDHFIEQVGDWNGDGHLDWMTERQEDGAYLLLPGPIASDGTTAPPFAELPIHAAIQPEQQEPFDLDGDGFDDMLMSAAAAPYYDPTRDQADLIALPKILFGPFSGYVEDPGPDASLIVVGPGAGVLAVVSDMDGDGDDEYVVGWVGYPDFQGVALLQGGPRL